MTEKVWVVLERAYEYNDEGYDSSEGGNLVVAFKSEAAANEEAKRRTLAALTGNADFVADMLGYGDWEWRLEDMGFEGLEYVDDHSDLADAIRSLSQEKQEELADRFDDLLFFVQETELA